jgi:dienelactone hydrolase
MALLAYELKVVSPEFISPYSFVMVQLYKPFMAFVCLTTFFIAKPRTARAQVQTPRVIRINPNCGGFYEYLPEGYQTNGAPYPLIVYLHGQGDLGNGSTDLPLLLDTALPKYIHDGQFPNSFTVSGQTHRFIVISPQFAAWPVAGDVEAVINYAVASYNVNPQRIYVTGMSMGGGATWDYAGSSTTASRRLAAIVPVCGASTPTSTAANNISATDLPVWATHNNDDPMVPVSNTNGFIDLINSGSPTPAAKKTIFPVTGHDAWTTTYNPAFEENGLNIYEWMLQYQRSASGPLPVKLTDYHVTASGSEVRIDWTTSWEDNNHHFNVEHSADGTHFSPLGEVTALNQATGAHYVYVDKQPYTGRNYYRLSQTDIDGKKQLLGIRELLLDPGSRTWLLYPNPATDHFILGVNQQDAGPLTVQIINAQGKIMRRDNYVKQSGYWQQRIPVAQLPAGIYTIHLKTGRLETTQKLVKN